MDDTRRIEDGLCSLVYEEERVTEIGGIVESVKWWWDGVDRFRVSGRTGSSLQW